MSTLKEIVQEDGQSHFIGQPEIEFIICSAKKWLLSKRQPVEGMQLRNNVKALLVLQGQQQMLEKLLKELE